MGVGIYGSVEDACNRVVQYGPVTEPDAARRRCYETLYQQFVGLYPTLREDFHRLSALPC
jgi:xylulokinase